jgi:hypothetical protein
MAGSPNTPLLSRCPRNSQPEPSKKYPKPCSTHLHTTISQNYYYLQSSSSSSQSSNQGVVAKTTAPCTGESKCSRHTIHRTGNQMHTGSLPVHTCCPLAIGSKRAGPRAGCIVLGVAIPRLANCTHKRCFAYHVWEHNKIQLSVRPPHCSLVLRPPAAAIWGS